MARQEQEFNRKIDLQIWRKLLRFAAPYRGLLIRLIIQMAFLGLFEAIFPLFSKFAIDNIVSTGRLELLIPFGLAALTVIAIQALNVRFMILRAGKIESYLPYDIRRRGFEHLQDLSLSFFDVTPVGWLMARLTSDCRRLGQTMSWNVVDLFWSVSMMLMTGVFMLWLNWQLALLVLITVPLLVGVSIFFQKRILQNHRSVRKYNSLITGGFNEGITGVRTIKTLTVEENMLEDFSENTEKMRSFAVKAATVSSLYTPVVLMLGALATGLVLWRGGAGAGLPAGRGISYGTLAAFVSYAVQFFEPVKHFARVFTELNSAQASAERVFSLIDTPARIVDKQQVIDIYGDQDDQMGRQEWPQFKGEIEFSDVSFFYDEKDCVLDHFNLKIKAGETVALVGETGSGKTTIANLACRFYEPVAGQVLIDGVDYRERPLMWLYSNLGYVLQDPHLFSGTVSENIAYGRRGISREQIEQAARAVEAHEFIMQLENTYDTEVGERGNRLSTGQKQLISFARAIVADPGIFVLDEATSSVDTKTEYQIQRALGRVIANRTSLIIAHRLSTVRHADRILVLDKGRVIEEGTHRELLKLRGYYWRLYTNQIVQGQIS